MEKAISENDNLANYVLNLPIQSKFSSEEILENLDDDTYKLISFERAYNLLT